MKIGITGASGFLGAAIIQEASSRGWNVVAFSQHADRPVEGAEETRSLADRENINLDGIDSLIHLAGEPIVGLWTRDKMRKIRESRVDLTTDLVEAMAKISRSRRPGAFVSASAVGYYGDRGDEWLDEESDVGFGFLPEVCRQWETASAPAAKLGVRVVNPRIGVVFGKGGFLKRLRPVFKSGVAGRLGRGNQWMSWIHIKDLARIFADCADGESSIRGRVNCVSPSPATNREFTQIYARVLGRKAFIPVPAMILKWLPGGMSSLFLESQRADPQVLKAFGFEWEFSILEDALRDVEGK
ncbi:MAG: TIGR01777 family oxidoreductase [Verrucomicrobiales bacterium]|nr:TIGR01777 family oxidoreductase [Verrucomicrobiales bacterium]